MNIEEARTLAGTAEKLQGTADRLGMRSPTVQQLLAEGGLSKQERQAVESWLSMEGRSSYRNSSLHMAVAAMRNQAKAVFQTQGGLRNLPTNPPIAND
jgi:hypothetical protein